MNTLNGYSKSTLTDKYVLTAAGGHLAVGNASGNIPLSNGTVNTNLNANLLEGYGASSFFRYEGAWDQSDTTKHVDNAHGMHFVYSTHGAPAGWGTLATFEGHKTTNYYNLLLYGEGSNRLYYRNYSPDYGLKPWRRVLDDDNTTISDYTVKINGTTKNFVRDWGHGATNMNAVAKGGRSSVGMADLSTPSGGTATAVNPNGLTGWHHFINISYTDGGGGSNSWITQIANKAGTTDLWVRSRNGGTISDTSNWAAPWVKILTSSNYTSYLGYIGTTAVQSSSAVQNLNGIGSISMAGDILIATNGDTGIRLLRMTCGGNDYGRVAVGATANNAGWMEIATADDGNDPIYVRQYTGTYGSIKNSITLLDASGNTSIPKNLNVGGYVGAASVLFNNNQRFNYGLAYYNSVTDTITGTIVITLPNGWINGMNTYEIDLYEYNGHEEAADNKLHSKIIISGYNYSGSISWVNYGYKQIGSYNKGIRLGYNGSKCVIMLGTTSTKWTYPQVHLSRVITGFQNQTSWSTGYSISVITDESSYSKIVTVNRVRLRFDDVVANNFRGNLVGTASNADTLDGIHANGLLTALSSNTTNKVSLTVGGTTKNITTLYASYLCSVGTVVPLTGRTQAYGNVYSYHTNASAWTGAPTTCTATIGFGKGTGGTVEICGEWTSGRGLWVRALRDTIDNWYAWDRILTEATYSKVLDNRYYTETEINTKLGDYVTLATAQNITGAKRFNKQLTVYTSASNQTPKIVFDEHYGPNWVSEIISDYYGTNVCTTDGFTHGLYIVLGRGNPFDNLNILDSTKTPIARISKDRGHYFAGTMQVTGNVTAPTFIGNLSGNATSANSATNIYVNQHTGNDIEYPLVWTNESNSSTKQSNLLYKSYNNLMYNPKNNRITASIFKGNLQGNATSATTAIDWSRSVSWNAITTVNAWSRILRINGYSNILLTVNYSLNSLASLHLYLVSTGYQTGNISLIGYNKYSSLSKVQVRLTRSSDTVFYVEIYNNYGHNSATTVTFGCRATNLSIDTSIEVYTAYTLGGGTVLLTVTSSHEKASNFNVDMLDGLHSDDFLRYYDANTDISNVNVVNTPSFLHTVSTTGNSPTTITKPSGIDNAWGVLHVHVHNGNYAMQLGFGGTTGNLYQRHAYSSSTFGSWKTILDSSNYSGILDSRYYTETEVNNKLAGYLPLSGGTMTGTLTVHTGSSLVGLKFGSSYLNSLSNQLLWQSSEAIRFGSTDWDWNAWAGLKYNHSSKIIYLGLADGTIFNANSGLSGGKLYLPGVSNIYTGNGANLVWHAGNDGSGSGLDADTLDGYHEYSFLRLRATTSTNGENTLWSLIGIKSYHNALPDGLSGLYTYGEVVSLAGNGMRLDIFSNHSGSENTVAQGLWWRSGWNNDKKAWRRIIDSGNIASLSVNYATSAGNADTVDNLHASDFVRAYGTFGTSYSYDSDWGLSIVTFDPVVSGTAPAQNPNISILNIGNAYYRRKQLAFTYSTNDIYYRRHTDSSWSGWVRLAIAGESYTKSEADSRFVNVTGDTMTGNLTVPSLNSYYLFRTTDIAEGAANLGTLATAHTITFFRNGIMIPYKMDNANDGGMIRTKGASEDSCVFEMATWDDSGAGETIQLNYYSTTSQLTPTYSNIVPKVSGTLLNSGNWPSYIGGYGYVMREYTIDATGLDLNTWYPVTMHIGARSNVRIEILVSLDSGSKPSWSTHTSGFSVRKIWEVNGSGWGTNTVNRTVFVSDYAHASTDPVRGMGDMGLSSTEYVYVRGGGRYYFYTSHNVTPYLRTSTYVGTADPYYQAISPTTTAPGTIAGFLINRSMYASHFYENSDIKLKENVNLISSSDNIPLLKLFDWKSDGKHSYGLIAQELEAMGYSELVEESGDHKTVNYSAALSLIVGKLQVKIKELEKEIEILKNKN